MTQSLKTTNNVSMLQSASRVLAPRNGHCLDLWVVTDQPDVSAASFRACPNLDAIPA
jgi:hypothetical protein